MESYDSEKVKEDCAHNWKLLKRIQADLEKVDRPVSSSVVEAQELASDASLDLQSKQILEEHEKRCKAELQFIRTQDLKSCPEDLALRELLLKQEKLKTIDQLRETLTFMQAKKEDVIEGIQVEEETNKQLCSLNKELKAKLTSIANQPSRKGDQEVEMVLADLEAKLDFVNKEEQYFRHELKNIMRKHFPLPTEQDVGRQLNDSREFDLNRVLPFGRIVKMLIEQSLNYPNQPYIELDDSIWPPHVEFLLKCQAVVKDPNNTQRIKLVPFHM